MAAWRYQISLLVFKKYLREQVKIFFNIQREILYLRAAI